mmetsp:Transcript_8078/g.31901  ORF Transcript_8078/g.31901 Transcript_8078/m.31901 type:complete len:212 (+) Transcript_8078:110-745(+)
MELPEPAPRDGLAPLEGWRGFGTAGWPRLLLLSSARLRSGRTGSGWRSRSQFCDAAYSVQCSGHSYAGLSPVAPAGSRSIAALYSVSALAVLSCVLGSVMAGSRYVPCAARSTSRSAATSTLTGEPPFTTRTPLTHAQSSVDPAPGACVRLPCTRRLSGSVRGSKERAVRSQEDRSASAPSSNTPPLPICPGLPSRRIPLYPFAAPRTRAV